MTFVAPWTALLAAAITVPLLLLLYFLKLRRRPLRIPSTLLWLRTFEDLQVNVPFQRLRYSLLLLMQALALLALLLALAQPRLEAATPVSSRVILLVDCSASMQARGPDGTTRLDAAQDAARRLVDRLGRGSEASEMMIVAFGASARVLSGFEAQRRRLREIIDAIEPTDEQADLEAALQLAGAFATRGEDAGQVPPDVVLISDGGVAPPAEGGGFRLRSGRFRYVRVGPESPDGPENVGIASFSARRDYEDPARVLVFARLVNAAPRPVEVVVTVEAEGLPPVTRSIALPAAGPDGPGEVPLTEAFDLPGGALLTIRHFHDDALDTDDTAALVLPPPTRPRIALVHSEDGADPFLRDLLDAAEPQELAEIAAPAFAQLDPRRLDTGELYDLVVFDGVPATRLPGVPTLTFGAVPAGLKAIDPAREGGQRVLSWDRQHPVMRYVSLDTVVFSGIGGLELPATATTLAQGPGGPVIAVLRTRGARHVVVVFELVRSNWPLQVSLTVFTRNVLDYLTLAGSGQQGLVARPGEVITARAASDTGQITIRGPVEIDLAVTGGEAVTLPVLRRVGLYQVEGAADIPGRLAVSLLSDVESDVRPRDTLAVNAEEAAATALAAAAPRELWPWLVMLAGALLIVEWLIYCRRARG